MGERGDDREAAGRAIRRLRNEKGMTQKALGDACGVTDSRVGQWEKGELTLDNAVAAESALDAERGSITRYLGYVPADTRVPTTPEDALSADPLLSAEFVGDMIALIGRERDRNR